MDITRRDLIKLASLVPVAAATPLLASRRPTPNKLLHALRWGQSDQERESHRLVGGTPEQRAWLIKQVCRQLDSQNGDQYELSELLILKKVLYISDDTDMGCIVNTDDGKSILFLSGDRTWGKDDWRCKPYTSFTEIVFAGRFLDTVRLDENRCEIRFSGNLTVAHNHIRDSSEKRAVHIFSSSPGKNTEFEPLHTGSILQNVSFYDV